MFYLILVFLTIALASFYFLTFWFLTRNNRLYPSGSKGFPTFTKVIAVIAATVTMVTSFTIFTPLDTTPIRLVLILIELVLMGSVMLYMVVSKNKDKAGYLIIPVITAGLTGHLASKIALGCVPWGGDEWAQLAAGFFLLDGYKIEYVATGYYQIPVVSIFSAIFSSVTGLPFLTTGTIVPLVLNLVFYLSCYMLILRLTKNKVVSIIALIFLTYIPRLQLVALNKPQGFAMALLPLLMLMLFHMLGVFSQNQSMSRRSLVLSFVLLWIISILIHPSGVVQVLLFSAFLIFTGGISKYINRITSIDFRAVEGRTRVSFFGILSVTTLSYWFLNEIIGVTLIKGNILPLLNTLRASAPLETDYIPLNTKTGDYYALDWSLSIGIGLGYYLWVLTSPRKAMKSKLNRIGLLCFSFGSVMLLVAFVAMIKGQTLPIDRFVGAPAYLFIGLSLAPPLKYIFSNLIDRRKKLVLLFTCMLLSAYISVGLTLPDRSPDLHKSVFEPITSRSLPMGGFAASHLEGTIVKSKDMVTPENFWLQARELNTSSLSRSYKPIRNILLSLETGESQLNEYPDITWILNSVHYPEIRKKASYTANIVADDGIYFMAQT